MSHFFLLFYAIALLLHLQCDLEITATLQCPPAQGRWQSGTLGTMMRRTRDPAGRGHHDAQTETWPCHWADTDWGGLFVLPVNTQAFFQKDLEPGTHSGLRDTGRSGSRDSFTASQSPTLYPDTPHTLSHGHGTGSQGQARTGDTGTRNAQAVPTGCSGGNRPGLQTAVLWIWILDQFQIQDDFHTFDEKVLFKVWINTLFPMS